MKRHDAVRAGLLEGGHGLLKLAVEPADVALYQLHVGSRAQTVGDCLGERIDAGTDLGRSVIVKFHVKRQKSDFDLVHCYSPMTMALTLRVLPRVWSKSMK